MNIQQHLCGNREILQCPFQLICHQRKATVWHTAGTSPFQLVMQVWKKGLCRERVYPTLLEGYLGIHPVH